MIEEKSFELPFEKTDFVKRIGKLSGKIIGESTEINEKGDSVYRPEYIETRKDNYVLAVTKSVSNMIFTFEQLKFVPIFLRRFPDRQFYESNGINHPKYLQYHLENHFLKAVTILDQCVRFVSEIYDLGIPPKLISLRQLSENKHTKNSESVKILKKIDKGIKGAKEIRNKITHRGEFYDVEIDKVATAYFVNEVREVNEKPIISELALKYQMKKVIKSKIQLVLSNTKKLENEILKLLVESQKEFEIRIKQF